MKKLWNGIANWVGKQFKPERLWEIAKPQIKTALKAWATTHVAPTLEGAMIRVGINPSKIRLLDIKGILCGLIDSKL
jgi:hypothetical protein